MKTFKGLLRLASAAALVCCGVAAHAAYPDRPVTLIVPFAPGGNLDLVARAIAPQLSETLGTNVIVENRPGAGGAIGAGLTARAKPDGYTLLVTTPNAITVLPHMADVPYTLKDFTSVGQVTETPLAVMVPKDSKYQNIKDFLSDAKANPHKISIGFSGIGTTNHLAILQIESVAKLSFNVVPYTGSGPALTDLMGHHIDSILDQMSSSGPHVQDGTLRALAMLTTKPDPYFPNVPTLAANGYPNFEAVTATGILGPAKMPKAIVDKLSAALQKALKSPKLEGQMKNLYSSVSFTTPQKWESDLQVQAKQADQLAAAGVLKAH